MKNPMEPMIELYEAQLQASRELANIILSGAERIDRIALQATKDGLNEQIAYAQALAAVKDLQSVMSMRTAFSQPNSEHALAFYQEMLKALSEIYAGMTQTVETYLKGIGQRTTQTMSSMGAGTPGGAHAADSVFEFWNSAWRQLAGMTEQYTRAMQASLKGKSAHEAAPAATATSHKGHPKSEK